MPRSEAYFDTPKNDKRQELSGLRNYVQPREQFAALNSLDNSIVRISSIAEVNVVITCFHSKVIVLSIE